MGGTQPFGFGLLLKSSDILSLYDSAVKVKSGNVELVLLQNSSNEELHTGSLIRHKNTKKEGEEEMKVNPYGDLNRNSFIGR